MNKKLISVVIPCYNEEENVEDMCIAIKKIFDEVKDYDYENIFIDNASKDNTVARLKKVAENDKHVKIIVNTRNFGHMRSPFHAYLQTKGDAVIAIPCDFQEPPELIKEFIAEWEKGYKIVIGVKTNSKESKIMFATRRLYYNIVTSLSDTELIKNFTGFGLYDRKIIDVLRTIDDPYPYFRGLICEIGYSIKEIGYIQQQRKKGATKNNFYALYDTAMLGITSNSKVPLRIATLISFPMALLSLFLSIIYFILKLVMWPNYPIGFAPLLIGMFFFTSVQLFFIGIIGEYVGAIYTQVCKRPLVIEKERINFD
ncbi:MAG: glycosyltransferase family 2 protein [Candidatus Eremiobacterota bacterium]